jgi:transposase
LHRVRERFVGQRTGIINQIRAFTLERGIAVGQGLRFLRTELLGNFAEEGSDREQRDGARDIYEARIWQSPVQGSQEHWKGIRDRWGEALTASGRGAEAVRPAAIEWRR